MGKKSYIDWNYLPAVRKSKCSSRYGQNDLFDLQEHVPSIDNSELCFHFSLLCDTIPWKGWGWNPASTLPGGEGDRCVSWHLAEACSSRSTHNQYCFCSWWHSQLGIKDQRCHTVTLFALLHLPRYSYPILYCPTGFHGINMPSSSASFSGEKNPTSFQLHPKVLTSVETLLSSRGFGSGHQRGMWYVGLPVTC